MKKRILSVVILALCILSVFAFASCGTSDKEALECTYKDCDGVLEASPVNENLLYCKKDHAHVFKICSNADCKEQMLENSEFCSKCGTKYTEPKEEEICQVCKDDGIETTYCPECGRQVEKKMKFKLDFDALGESAMILCKGMLGIFIVTGVIIAFILILNTVVEKVNQIKENKENK